MKWVQTAPSGTQERRVLNTWKSPTFFGGVGAQDFLLPLLAHSEASFPGLAGGNHFYTLNTEEKTQRGKVSLPTQRRRRGDPNAKVEHKVRFKPQLPGSQRGLPGQGATD